MFKLKQSQVFIVGLCIGCISFGYVYAQKSDNQAEQLIERAYEKALKKVDLEKEKKQEKLSAELKAKLESAIEDWMRARQDRLKAGLDKFIKQNWETYPSFLTASHYEYLLRDFSLSELSRDIAKTESVSAPYKAAVNFSEKLFVERDHPSNISNRSDYLFTVATPVNVIFEYQGGKFNIFHSEEGLKTIKNGWPQAK